MQFGSLLTVRVIIYSKIQNFIRYDNLAPIYCDACGLYFVSLITLQGHYLPFTDIYI